MAKESTDDLKKAQSKASGPESHGAAMLSDAKANDFNKAVKNLVDYLKNEKFKVLLVVAFAIIGTVLSILGPKILAGATNKIQNYVIKDQIYSQIQKNLPEGQKIPTDWEFQNFANKMRQETDQQFAKSGAELEKAPPAIRAASLEKLNQARKSADEQVSKAQETVDKVLKNLSGDQRKEVASMKLSEKPQMDFGFIGEIILLMLGFYSIAMLFGYIQGFLAAGITQRMALRMRRDLSRKINEMPLKYFDSRQFGDILSRITNDVDLVQQSMSQVLSSMISSLTMVIGIPIMMFTISWQMALISLSVIPISMFFVMRVVKISQKYFAQQQEVLGKIDGQIEEVYAGHSVVKVFGSEKKTVAKFSKYNDDLHDTAWKSQFLSGLMWPISNIVGNLGYVGVALMGGWLAINQGMGVGDILAFIQYVQQFNQPIMQLSQIMNMLQPMAAGAERVFEFLEEPNEIADPAKPVKLKNVRGSVEFKDVKFAYEPGKPIIKNFTASVKPGATVAIVGPTGAGKTTIVNLLMRFYDPESGEITIDGVNTRDMTRADVRKNFAMVLQDTWLFSGTIRENLSYGKHDATDQEIAKIAEAAHVDHFIRSLPHGYETILSEDAENISAGEKQLLTIARAMLANPPMLILDEATSNVDTRTESHIQHAMLQLMKGRTSFVIAHRLSTIRDADLILVMDHGDIVESGNHASLLLQNGFYAKLYNSQFDEPAEDY